MDVLSSSHLPYYLSVLFAWGEIENFSALPSIVKTMKDSEWLAAQLEIIAQINYVYVVLLSDSNEGPGSTFFQSLTETVHPFNF